MTLDTGLTAVIIEIPEALPAVGSWRARFDTSAPLGVPPHVTIVFPFLQLATMTADDRHDLATIIAAEPAFAATFASLRTFARSSGAPEVLYLAPTPVDPFRRLTSSVAARWPQCPPYGGIFEEVIPHLTITETATPEEVSAARQTIGQSLPVRVRVDAVSLIAFDGTLWRRNTLFPLGSGVC